MRRGFELLLESKEVEDTFEVPLISSSIRPITGCVRGVRGFTGEEVEFCDIPYGERNIWGATAGMLLTLYRLCARSRRDELRPARRSSGYCALMARLRDPRARLSLGPAADLREHRALHDRGGLRGRRRHRARRSGAPAR